MLGIILIIAAMIAVVCLAFGGSGLELNGENRADSVLLPGSKK
jgi:hypothetical protein